MASDSDAFVHGISFRKYESLSKQERLEARSDFAELPTSQSDQGAKVKSVVAVDPAREPHPNRAQFADMESEERLCRDKRQETSVTVVLVLSIIGSMFGAVEFGYNTGVINAPQTVIGDFINETLRSRDDYESSPSQERVTLIWSSIVAVFAVGGMLGGSVAGWWADKFGRKNGMLFNNAAGIVAALLLGLAKVAHSLEMLIVGRLVVGFCSAIFTGLTPMYLTEVAPSHLRGALGTVNQLGVTIGLLVSQVLGINLLLGSEHLWEVLLALSVVPCLLMLVTLPFCPESPRFLLISRQREKEAREALTRLRGSPGAVNDEIQEMKNEAERESDVAKVGILQLLRTRDLLKPLLICVVMQLSQQLSGINAVFFYSTKIFVSAGLTQSAAEYATIGTGGIMVVMTIVSIPLMDRAGRRTLHLLGLGGMFLASIGITVGLLVRPSVDWFRFVTVISALIFVVFFAIGPGSIPWMITAELFSQGPRPAAVSIAIVVNWTASFVVGLGFPAMQLALGYLTFIPFTILLAGFWLFTYFVVPETKNKTIDEISFMFRKQATNSVATGVKEPI